MTTRPAACPGLWVRAHRLGRVTSAPAPLVDAPVDATLDATLDATAPAAGRDDRPATRPGLSPSRAGDFLQCPLLFRFRTIDRLPEPPSSAAARGTLVHAVLEHLFGLPAVERTLEAAHALLPEQWAVLREEDPRVTELFADDGALTDWLGSARSLLATYFTLEDPTRLEPAERELYVVTELEDGPQLRGIVDRVDIAPNGWIRVVDYKTGRSPRAGYESTALFQMRFYAYVLWRTRGVLPKRLQLEYLGDGTLLQHEPTEPEMETFEARIRSIWTGIQDAARAGDWRTRRSKLCDWCSFREHCPEYGGTPPIADPDAVERATGVRPGTATGA
ncbi:recombinase RecB [Cellulomonas gelida]|uniref:Recombinase RecB n=1 Tax=Cellulomonas gelida TaxID=1712 RepID=A0A4Y3KHT3_9CELL|nr:recombinase RecB [Cellulomonas gelida]GGL35181.1 recombinase RecB [Cellulomonas gelida]